MFYNNIQNDENNEEQNFCKYIQFSLCFLTYIIFLTPLPVYEIYVFATEKNNTDNNILPLTTIILLIGIFDLLISLVVLFALFVYFTSLQLQYTFVKTIINNLLTLFIGCQVIFMFFSVFEFYSTKNYSNTITSVMIFMQTFGLFCFFLKMFFIIFINKKL